MSIEKVAPETVALASNLHPSKVSGNNQSVAEKEADRTSGEKVKNDPGGVATGRGIKIDVDT